MYEGPERRQSMVDLDERMRTIETQVSVVNATTKDFREYLIKKIDKLDISMTEIRTRLFELPCKERSGFYKNIRAEIIAMWLLIVGSIGYLFKHITDK